MSTGAQAVAGVAIRRRVGLMAITEPVNTDALSAEAWVGGRSISAPQIAPDGQWVSFFTRSSDCDELSIVPAAGGPEAWLGLSPKSAGKASAWTHDSKAILYWGQDKCVHLFDVTSATSRAVSPEIENLSGLTCSPQGGVFAAVTDLSTVVVCEFDKWPQKISGDADFVVDPIWTPDGTQVVWTQWSLPNMQWDRSEIVVAPIGGGSIEVLVGQEKVAAQQPRFSPDGSQLAYLSDGEGWLNLYVMDYASRTSTCLVKENSEHGAPIWGPGSSSVAWIDGTKIAFVKNTSGWSSVSTVEVSTGQVAQMSSLGLTSLSCGSSCVAGIESGPSSATSLIVFDAGGSKHVLARLSWLGLESRAVEPELVSWDAQDGSTIFGRLYRSGSEPAPMLIWSHGGPTDQSGATLYHRFGYFLERGWSLLAVDYRGSSGWGRSYTQKLQGRWGELDVADVASAAVAAIGKGWADPQKVVAMGSSAGGFTSLHLAAKYPDVFAAVVVYYPVCDLVEMNELTHRFEAHYMESMIGPLPEAHELYVERSPINFADKIEAPALILHGSDDPVVPVEQSRRLAQALEGQGNDVEFHVYEGEGHGWKRRSNRVDELRRTEAFLRKHVLHVGSRTEGHK
jgi:dipeptidyl aminopeptidase/acylaminoacyl peptidase